MKLDYPYVLLIFRTASGGPGSPSFRRWHSYIHGVSGSGPPQALLPLQVTTGCCPFPMPLLGSAVRVMDTQVCCPHWVSIRYGGYIHCRTCQFYHPFAEKNQFPESGTVQIKDVPPPSATEDPVGGSGMSRHS